MPRIRDGLREVQAALDTARFSLACVAPAVVRPKPRKITMAITAHCNLRCKGCRYGRDFMPGAVLPFSIIEGVLLDAAAAGIDTIRLYGGEPLLHPDLPAIIRRARELGIAPYVTTNGTLLGRHIDRLVDAGLRGITVGFYGVEADYDDYVQRRDQFRRLEESLSTVRKRHGQAVRLQLNFLLSRISCSVEAVDAAWQVAKQFDMRFHTDLIHYSLPYFTEGENGFLQFKPEDAEQIQTVVAHLVSLKREDPRRFPEPIQSLTSIPDWLLKGPQMRIPCDAEKLIWIGADGTVQLCYVTFKLGNLHEKRLSSMLFTEEHRQAASDAFRLNCPNCHCERASRVVKHIPSRIRYRDTIDPPVPDTPRDSA